MATTIAQKSSYKNTVRIRNKIGHSILFDDLSSVDYYVEIKEAIDDAHNFPHH